MFHSNGFRRGQAGQEAESVSHLDELMDYTREIFARKFREIDLDAPHMRAMSERLAEKGPDLHIDFGLDELEPLEELISQRPAM